MPRFDEKEDCYFDTVTGFEWSLKSHGPMRWQDAIVFCQQLGSGWRLPTIRELLTLINYNKVKPATELPNMMSVGYWSSTTYAYYTDYAWVVYFCFGDNYWLHKSDYFYVRAVRGESLSLEK